jgi:tRNA(fMet)-specific endonuclease VapC
MTHYVLDTNIVSAYLRGNLVVKARFHASASPANLFLGCPMVWHEIRRGLIAKGSTSKMRQFEQLYDEFHWQNYDFHDWSTAADLWVKRQALGKPIADADLLIAVFALNRRATLVTNNRKDFTELGVSVEDWLTS